MEYFIYSISGHELQVKADGLTKYDISIDRDEDSDQLVVVVNGRKIDSSSGELFYYVDSEDGLFWFTPEDQENGELEISIERVVISEKDIAQIQGNERIQKEQEEIDKNYAHKLSMIWEQRYKPGTTGIQKFPYWLNQYGDEWKGKEPPKAIKPENASDCFIRRLKEKAAYQHALQIWANKNKF